MKKVVYFFLFSAFVDILIVFVFRFFRFLFPPASIGSEKIIGYAQYYKYPLYFDNVVFFVFLFAPIVLVFIAKKWLRNK